MTLKDRHDGIRRCDGKNVCPISLYQASKSYEIVKYWTLNLMSTTNFDQMTDNRTS